MSTKLSVSEEWLRELVSQPEHFKQWLDEHPDVNGVAGLALVCARCPFAEFLKARGFLNVHVDATITADTETGYTGLPTPDWLLAFIEHIDYGLVVGQSITVQMCRNVMEAAWIGGKPA